MKTKWAAFWMVAVVLLCIAAQPVIQSILYTSKPNAVPVGSDFFGLQRNSDFINSSVNQHSNMLFTSPFFTGTPAFTGIPVGDGSGFSNVTGTATTTYISNFTNNTFTTTNVAYVNYETNNTFVNTNITLLTSNAYINNEYVTNLTIVGSGTGAFIPDNNGNGTNTTNWGVSTFQEIDAENFFPTNTYLPLTNSPYLATDGDGKPITGTGLSPTNILLVAGNNITFTTNVDGSVTVSASGSLTITTITNTTIYSATNFSTNLYYVTGKGNTLIVTNVAIYGLQTNFNVAASSAVISKSDQTFTNAVNAHGVFTNTASGPPSFGLLQAAEIAPGIVPVLDLSSSTNLIYRYTTNIVGAANFVFGKAYWTNITGNFTFPALTMQDSAAMETLSVWVTNSGASTFTATINGVAGAPGHVVPAVFYCTNATVTEIDVSHFGVLWTNACVGKN